MAMIIFFGSENDQEKKFCSTRIKFIKKTHVMNLTEIYPNTFGGRGKEEEGNKWIFFGLMVPFYCGE